MKRALFSFVTLLSLGSGAMAAESLQLDFTQFGGPYSSGWTPVEGNFLNNTPVASTTNINGAGYNFSVNNVGVYDNGNAGESLTRSGFYTFGNNTNDHTFTLSNLPVGAEVSLYAVAAWDGNGRGATVVFGDSGASGVVAQTIGDPGTSPTVANFTHIGDATVGGTGILTGTLNGHAGVGTGDEGQVGGFLISVTAVPEPTSLGLAALGGTIVLARRRRNRSV